MKKGIRKCLALALAAVLALSCGVTAFAADSGVVTVQADVTYGQTEARSMLAMINAFRTGTDAWYWNSDNTTKTTLTNLSELTYDYTLEQVAMQRAVEVALSFSHTRPDGTSCFTAYQEAGYTAQSMGENIAAGYATVQEVFTGWQETDDNYSGQGHRRNMLSSNFTAVGIGHVVYQGVHYWVQEFGKASAVNTTATPAQDTAGRGSVNISTNRIVSAAVTQTSEKLELQVGDSVSLPAVTVNLQLDSAWPSKARPVTVEAAWSAGSGGIVELSGATLTAAQVGTTALTAQVCGEAVSIPVYVFRFTDVAPDAWYCAAVEYVVGSSLFNGVGEDRMDPTGDMNRAMFVTALYRMADSPAATGASPFTDLKDDWYRDAVQWAYKTGITSGMTAAEFFPNGKVTREQIAVFLYRYAKYIGADVTSGVTGERYNSFADHAAVDEWAVDAMIWATDTGIINGSDVGIEPLRNTSRAECAQMFVNFARNVLGE